MLSQGRHRDAKTETLYTHWRPASTMEDTFTITRHNGSPFPRPSGPLRTQRAPSLPCKSTETPSSPEDNERRAFDELVCPLPASEIDTLVEFLKKSRGRVVVWTDECESSWRSAVSLGAASLRALFPSDHKVRVCDPSTRSLVPPRAAKMTERIPKAEMGLPTE